MLTLLLIAALLILLVSAVVAAIRRHDESNYFDQDREPFYAEPQRLANAGLLYDQRDRDGRPQRVYTITPAGEAALRGWLREPANDPGLLRLFFGGFDADPDIAVFTDQRRQVHASRLAEYERIEQLLGNRAEWRYALTAARMGARFERACLEFWDRERAGDDVGVVRAPDGARAET